MKFVAYSKRAVLHIFVLLIISGCGGSRSLVQPVILSESDRSLCRLLSIEEEVLAEMLAKPLYEFSPGEVDLYLGYLQAAEPDLRARIQHLARKTVGQPYRIYLLGEYPFELYDDNPLFSLQESDCVVFSEHMYAMALAHDWRSFMVLLQRIRYKNGEIGMLTRNHYTEADWDINNSWLVEDITAELAGAEAVRDTIIIKRARFFSRYGIGQEIPDEKFILSYIPYQLLPGIIDRLHPGDFVNIVRGSESGTYVGHVGLITRNSDGQVNFLHSTWPRVKEQPLMELFDTAETYNAERRRSNLEIMKYNEEAAVNNHMVEVTGKGNMKEIKSLKPYFYGFKFLRLRANPLETLKAADGPDGPRVLIRASLK
ncbi:DUF1460 domain-containing protein [bacterium]|nr:DUF1460 domain-containing protein [bacterium]